MKGSRFGFLCLGVLLASGCASAPRDDTAVTDAWYEPEIRAFEAADRANPIEPGKVLFTGSSSVRMWQSLAEDMAPAPVINRGFGGSQTREVLAVADRIVWHHEPSVIVYYCGDNDLGTDNTDSRAAADGFIAFADEVHERLPNTKVLYLAIKPSLARWNNWPAMERANAMVAEYCDEHDFAEFLDVASPLLNASGEPNEAYFLDDGLHLNGLGYARWTDVVRPRVISLWISSRLGG